MVRGRVPGQLGPVRGLGACRGGAERVLTVLVMVLEEENRPSSEAGRDGGESGGDRIRPNQRHSWLSRARLGRAHPRAPCPSPREPPIAPTRPDPPIRAQHPRDHAPRRRARERSPPPPPLPPPPPAPRSPRPHHPPPPMCRRVRAVSRPGARARACRPARLPVPAPRPRPRDARHLSLERATRDRSSYFCFCT
jgi:hypothetical protein